MSQSLFLTRQEQAIFARLSDKLREGWAVTPETIDNFETAEELHMRFRIAHFNDTACLKLAEAARKATTADEFEALTAMFDIRTLPKEELAELFFVLGLRVTSAMIAYLLYCAKTDTDLGGVAALTAIRHALKESNIPS